MCGIAALSLAPGSALDADPRPLLRSLAVACEVRGAHATGFGWTDESGWPTYWKAAGPARRRAFEAPLPARTANAIVHTRYATQGSPAENVNNHPVVAPGVVLVHNGVISNDDDLFAELGAERAGEVDSEALAALLAYGEGAPGPLLARAAGKAAVAWLDTEDAVLRLARVRTSPLAFGQTAAGDFVAASTPAILAEATRRVGVRLWGVEEVAEGTYVEVLAGRIVTMTRFAVGAAERPPALFDDRTFYSYEADRARRRGAVLAAAQRQEKRSRQAKRRAGR